MSCDHCDALLAANGENGKFFEELMCSHCGAVFVLVNSQYLEFANIGHLTVVLLNNIIRHKSRGWNMRCPVCNKEVEMIVKAKDVMECPECHSGIKDGQVLDNGKIPIATRRQVIINHQAHL